MQGREGSSHEILVLRIQRLRRFCARKRSSSRPGQRRRTRRVRDVRWTHNGLCDDALVEVLVRLPSESVLRCRAVCKTWRRITTDSSFLVAHAARRPLEMITLTQSWTVSAVPLSPNLDTTDDGRRCRYLCDPSLYDKDGNWTDWGRLLASLDGLLVLQQRPGLYVVCNPTTRAWTSLPVLAPEPCSTVFVCGFYFHKSSGEYRLLCHGEVDAATAGVWKDYYYYTLSAGATLPRRLTHAPADRPIEMGYEYPVAHRGILYWFCLHPEATRTGKMLAFHTASETFRLMSRPPCNTFPALLELDGELCAVDIQGVTTLLDIWVLQDHKTESWTLRHRVVVPPPSWPIGGDLLVSSAISAGCGVIFMGDPSSHVVRLCNVKDKRMHHKEIYFHSTPTFLVFSESLLSHAFFDSPRCPELAPPRFPD